MSSPASPERQPLAPALFTVLLIVFSALLAAYMSLPPSPLPADAPDTEFSAERAFKHYDVIARVTHPAGTRANEKIRDYILAELQALGIDAEIDVGKNAGGIFGIAQNVMARIPGTANTKAFALEAHYDSVPYGPGAADDCAGVVAMLETARALKAGPPLANDVIFVFSDGEECGLLGAKAFTAHPWFNETGVLLNFEARGTSGPSYMFETSEENGWLIAEMIKAKVHPRATSIMFDVYKPLPFSSDLSALKRSGIKGFNVAFVDDFCHYHTREDRPENLSLASLQHHGSYALGLARHFGNISLENVTAPDATYFNTIGSHMVHYPLSWGKRLALMATLLLAAVLALGLIRRQLTLGGLFAGVGVFALCALACAVVVALLSGFAFLIHGHYLLYNNSLYGAAFGLIALCIALLLYAGFSKGIRLQNLAAGAHVSWLILLVFMETFMPGGSYIVLWPLLFSTVGLGLLFLSSSAAPLPAWRVAVLALFAVPGILLFVPSLIAFLATLTILFTFALAVFLVLLVGLLIPQLNLVVTPNRWWLSVLAGVLGVMVFVVALATNGASPSKPRYDCLSYGLDLDAGRAFWLSNDKAPDEWTAQFFPPGTERAPIPEFIHGHDGEYLKAPAPVARLDGPKVEVIRDGVANGKRDIVLRIDSPQNASKLRFYVTSDTEVFSANVFGKDVGGRKRRWGQGLNLFPHEGIEAALKVDPSEPLLLKVIEQFFGLPPLPGIRPRPDHLITEPNTTLDWHRPLRSEHTFVTRTFTFPVSE